MQANELDQPIAGITYRQLRELIAEEVRAQMSEGAEGELRGYLQEPDPGKAAEAIRWLFDHQWTPPPGSPSVVQLIREDRDR